MRGGCYAKDGKRRSEKGCVPAAAALQNHHMGHVEYSPFLCILRPYIKRSLYSLYLQEEAPLLPGQSG